MGGNLPSSRPSSTSTLVVATCTAMVRSRGGERLEWRWMHARWGRRERSGQTREAKS